MAGGIFSDPGFVVAGVYAPMGKAEVEGDFYRVSGRWKWNSGGQNATWLCGGAMIFENGAPRMLNENMPEHRMMLFPASEAQFIDTWHTGGLRGSGSGDMAVTDLLVPAWSEAQTAPAIGLEQRARLRLAATHMTRTAAEVVRTVQDLAGGGAVFLSSTLQRRLADAQTTTAHIMIAPATYELTGRALLGVPVSAAEL